MVSTRRHRSAGAEAGEHSPPSSPQARRTTRVERDGALESIDERPTKRARKLAVASLCFACSDSVQEVVVEVQTNNLKAAAF